MARVTDGSGPWDESLKESLKKKSPKKPYTYHFTANTADIDVNRIIEEAVAENQNVRFIIIKGKGDNCLVVLPEKLAEKYPVNIDFGFPVGPNMPHGYSIEQTDKGLHWISWRKRIIRRGTKEIHSILPQGWVCCTAISKNIKESIQQALNFLKKPTVEVTVW